MDELAKKKRMKELVVGLLEDSQEIMISKIDHALNSGLINVEDWDGTYIEPKCIGKALLESEADSYNYSGKGTTHERKVKKQVKNLRNVV